MNPWRLSSAKCLATRIREVKQLKKAQGKFTGGKRPFGYDIVQGIKTPRADEQEIIRELQLKRQSGLSYRAIEQWLKAERGIRLSFMGVKDVLSKAEIRAENH